MRKFRLALQLLLLATLSCHLRTPGPFERLDQAANQASDASKTDARTLALAGFHAYLREGNASKAENWFGSALKKDSSDPYALYGTLLLARRRAHPERALTAALDILERAARHPLASVAGRVVLDLAGTATALDDQVFARSERIFAAQPTGEAAYLFRGALATIYSERAQRDKQESTLSAMGIPTLCVLVGPFSPYRILSFDETVPLERTGSLSGPLSSPFGTLKPRTLRFPEGRLSLLGEAGPGDIYFVVIDFDAAESATHVIRTAMGGSYKVFLDGTLVFQRRGFERASPSLHAAGVQIKAGPHRLLLKISKEERNGNVLLGLPRADGRPANLRFRPAEGTAPNWSGAELKSEVPIYPGAPDLAKALEPEAGAALASFLAIRDAMGRDADGAKELAPALEGALATPSLASLKGDLDLLDRTIPAKVARGRATRDYEAANEKDPAEISALLARAQLALDDNRLLEASEFLKQARAAYDPPGYPVSVLEARVYVALGIDAQAEQSAQEALKAQAGLCDALSIRYDLARRRDAIAAADNLVTELKPCPGGLVRAAEHAKLRGDVERAIGIFEELALRDPNNISNGSTLADLYVTKKRFADAEKVLQRLLSSWPNNAGIYKRLADAVELGGDRAKALQYRKTALSIDGGDLQLRRTVDRAETGKELLEQFAISGKKAIEDYEAQRGMEDASSTYILDFAAMRAYADGSIVDRIHVIQKALDQSGVSEIAEVAIPAGAQVLSLRTIKPDGTVLEPENIENKETISMPGVQIGDYVEYEFLLAHRSRGPAEPGFTAANFYFQIARAPNNWSTYTVIAPRGTGMTVDAHNVTSPSPAIKGDEEVFLHEERRVPPLIPEPNAPPSATEYLPFVSVGAGETGNEGLLKEYADAYLDRGQLTYEVMEAARTATRGKSGVEAVQAWYSAVMNKLSGHDSGLTQSAAFSLAQDRGSRLWALKAGLEAIGIPARLVAVRTFSVDPAPYKFPNEALLPYLCVRAELPNRKFIWLDPVLRFGPFGILPQQAANGREAFLLPEPGLPLQKVTTPPNPQVDQGKRVSLKLKLELSGKLTGVGDETYQGADAAQLAEALERVSADQRNQALQSALSRYFGGAEMSNLRLDIKQEVGAPLTVHYEFSAPQFARIENGKLVLPPITYPAQLGRRFVQMGSRKTPLYIDSTEVNVTQVILELPPGYVLSSPIPELKTRSPFGAYERHERQQGARVQIDENFELRMARIPPAQYEDFGQFAGEVDLVQSRDLLVEKQ